MRLSLRMRLQCTFSRDAAGVVDVGAEPLPLESQESVEPVPAGYETEIEAEASESLAYPEASTSSMSPINSFTALNEVVINRGPSPYLTQLEVWCNGGFLTTIQGDGVIIGTPTGSTAYSMAAGGSIVHPAVPAILITPVSPHSLSCRPLLLPDSAVIKVINSAEARADAWVTLDGNRNERLRRGESIYLSMSPNPLATVNNENSTADWFDAIASAFNFNNRISQKPFPSGPSSVTTP